MTAWIRGSAHEGRDSRVAADRMRGDSHVAALALTHPLAVTVANTDEASLGDLHAWRDLRRRAVVPDGLAMHAGHDAHTRVRDTVHAGPDLRHDTDVYARVAMLAGCAADTGAATASAPAPSATRATAAGVAAMKDVVGRCEGVRH